LILFVLIFTLCLSGCGKKAKPIELPSTDNISSIEIAGGLKDTIITDKKMIASFIKKVAEAIPTSKQSVQDVPTVSEYTRVDFVSDGNISSIFIYQENSKWYIEQPYHGIYETDEIILKLLKNN
jgi:predicted small lipoprotein YifL